MDEIMNNVSAQIQRVINDAISSQVLPQIQNALNDPSQKVKSSSRSEPVHIRLCYEN